MNVRPLLPYVKKFQGWKEGSEVIPEMKSYPKKGLILVVSKQKTNSTENMKKKNYLT